MKSGDRFIPTRAGSNWSINFHYANVRALCYPSTVQAVHLTKQNKKKHTLSSLTSRDSAVDASWIFSAGELPLSRAEPQSEGRRLRLQQRSEPRPSRSLVRQPLLIPDPDPLLGFPCLSSVRRHGLHRPAEERAAWHRHRDGGGASRRRPAARSPRSRLLQPFQGADRCQILIRRSRFNTT